MSKYLSIAGQRLFCRAIVEHRLRLVQESGILLFLGRHLEINTTVFRLSVVGVKQTRDNTNTHTHARTLAHTHTQTHTHAGARERENAGLLFTTVETPSNKLPLQQ